MSSPVLHVVVHFYGHVQGVGFRYTTRQVAKEFEVAGFVKNQTDGSVLLEAEGQAKAINDFIAAIEDRMHGYLRRTERTQQSRPPVFQGFEIR